MRYVFLAHYVCCNIQHDLRQVFIIDQYIEDFAVFNFYLNAITRLHTLTQVAHTLTNAIGKLCIEIAHGAGNLAVRWYNVIGRTRMNLRDG